MEIIGKLYLSRRNSLNFENVLCFFAFLVFPTSHSPPPSLYILPAHEEQLSENKGEFSCCRMCKAPQTQELLGLRRIICCAHHFLLLLPGSQVSAFSLSYFSCLSSDLAPSWFPPGYTFRVWTAFPLCSGSLDLFLLTGPQILFHLWLSSTRYVLPCLFLKMNHPGESNWLIDWKALSDELKVI